jgi:hypothetical protein
MIDAVQHSLRRYTKALVHPFEDTWRRELEIIVARFERLRAGDPAGAADAVRRGHADLLEAAVRRVEAREPTLMPYLAPAAAGEVATAS